MPGTPATTPKLGLPRYSNNDVADFGGQVNAVSDRLDLAAAGDSQGPLASRPAAGQIGRYYFSTNTNQLFRDTGTTWFEVGSKAVSDLLVQYKTLYQVHTWFIGEGASTRPLRNGYASTGLSEKFQVPLWNNNGSDYNLTNRTSKMRVDAFWAVNAVAPGVTFNCQLAHIDSVSQTGGFMEFAFSTVTGSTATMGSNPAAGGTTETHSSDFDPPVAGGMYCLVSSPSGTMVTGSVVSVTARLTVRTL